MSKTFWKLIAVGSLGYAAGVCKVRMPYSYARNGIIANLRNRINEKVNRIFGFEPVYYPRGNYVKIDADEMLDSKEET